MVSLSLSVDMELTVLLLSYIAVAGSQTSEHYQSHIHRLFKRQIFREQVLPHAGGKIPEDAFRSDRLALNRLNKEGITVPDGVLLQARYHENHHNSHRNDPDITGSIIRLVQKPDGRYAPPEGEYPFDSLVESTYIIRPPTTARHPIRLHPYRPIEVPLRLPGDPFFPSDAHEEESLANHVDSILGLDPLEGARATLNFQSLWPGPLFPGPPGRILRDTVSTIKNITDTRGKTTASTVQEKPPRLITIPTTSFTCDPHRSGMFADPEAECQVFHLCHVNGQKESFLCPRAMRFDSKKSQCLNWKEVPCKTR